MTVALFACSSGPSDGSSAEDPDGGAAADAAVNSDSTPDVSCDFPMIQCGSSCCETIQEAVVTTPALRVFGATDHQGASSLLYTTEDGAYLLSRLSSTFEVEPQDTQFREWISEATVGANLAARGNDLAVGVQKHIGQDSEVALLTRTDGTWERSVVSPVDTNGLDDYIYAVPYVGLDLDANWELRIRGAKVTNGDMRVDHFTKGDTGWSEVSSWYSGQNLTSFLRNAFAFTRTSQGDLSILLAGTFPRLSIPDLQVFRDLDFQTTSFHLVKDDVLEENVILYTKSDGLYLLKYPFEGQGERISAPLEEEEQTRYNWPVRAVRDTSGNLHICFATSYTGTPRFKSIRYIVQGENGFSTHPLTERGFGYHLTHRDDGSVDIFYGEVNSDDTNTLQHLQVRPI